VTSVTASMGLATWDYSIIDISMIPCNCSIESPCLGQDKLE
jgi:hypothetical protein